MENFHCYKGQDEDQHKHFDDADMSSVRPNYLEDFDNLYGARSAIEACAKLATYFTRKTRWEGEVEDLFIKEIFKLSPNVSSSNTEV